MFHAKPVLPAVTKGVVVGGFAVLKKNLPTKGFLCFFQGEWSLIPWLDSPCFFSFWDNPKISRAMKTILETPEESRKALHQHTPTFGKLGPLSTSTKIKTPKLREDSKIQADGYLRWQWHSLLLWMRLSWSGNILILLINMLFIWASCLQRCFFVMEADMDF